MITQLNAFTKHRRLKHHGGETSVLCWGMPPGFFSGCAVDCPRHFHESCNHVFFQRRMRSNVFPVILLTCPSCHWRVPHHLLRDPNLRFHVMTFAGSTFIQALLFLHQESSQNRSKCFHNWNIAIAPGPRHRFPNLFCICFCHRWQIQFPPCGPYYPVMTSFCVPPSSLALGLKVSRKIWNSQLCCYRPGDTS